MWLPSWQRAAAKIGATPKLQHVVRLNYSDPFPNLGFFTILDYGVVLVAGLDYGSMHRNHDLCLYFVDAIPEIDGIAALIVILEDLLQARPIYQTILHRVMLMPGKSKQLPESG
jgi:hypothetical protein